MRYRCAAVTFFSILSIPVVSLCADVTFYFAADTSLIVVPVTINGHGPYRFLLDTGATNTILSDAIADSLRIPRRRRARILTAGGNIDVTVRMIKILNVGTAQLENIEIAAGNFDLLKQLKVDGLLGGDCLRRFRLEIDYDGKVLKLETRNGEIG